MCRLTVGNGDDNGQQFDQKVKLFFEFDRGYFKQSEAVSSDKQPLVAAGRLE